MRIHPTLHPISIHFHQVQQIFTRVNDLNIEVRKAPKGFNTREAYFRPFNGLKQPNYYYFSLLNTFE